MENEILDLPDTYKPSPQFAGFWLRFAAYILDSVFISIPVLVIYLTIGGDLLDPSPSGRLLGLLVSVSYFILFESSEKQATFGKQIVGIVVTDEQGERISIGQATGRYFGKLVSGLILGIGFIMAGFTDKKQALHDIMAKTLVIRRD
ncbi:MAG: hypothetical protein RLY31_582 [Bacteroidota bacterium]|jgi:uncharacterized RDD family membrane protein YckC